MKSKFRQYKVTLHARVWIETLTKDGDEYQWSVTLHARVWIETPICVKGLKYASHPPREGVD